MDTETRHRQSHLLNAFLLVCLWGFSLSKWPDLPDRIPVHFTFSGEPDRWAATDWGHWFALPLVALGLTALLYAVAFMVRRYPRYVNLPSKRAFLELAQEQRGPILDLVSDLLYRVTALVNIQWLLAQMGTYQVAVGSAERLPAYVRVAMLLIVPLAVIVTIFTILRVRALIHRNARSYEAGTRLGGQAR